MLTEIINFINEFENCTSEDFRYNLSLEVETNDKLKKKITSLKSYNFTYQSRIFKVEPLKNLRNKSDLLYFIKNSNEIISISSLFFHYKFSLLKKDLFELVKFKQKERFFFLYKNKKNSRLFLFRYNQYFLAISIENILLWYEIGKNHIE
jgi:hypothetical protein